MAGFNYINYLIQVNNGDYKYKNYDSNITLSKQLFIRQACKTNFLLICAGCIAFQSLKFGSLDCRAHKQTAVFFMGHLLNFFFSQAKQPLARNKFREWFGCFSEAVVRTHGLASVTTIKPITKLSILRQLSPFFYRKTGETLAGIDNRFIFSKCRRCVFNCISRTASNASATITAVKFTWLIRLHFKCCNY